MKRFLILSLSLLLLLLQGCLPAELRNPAGSTGATTPTESNPEGDVTASPPPSTEDPNTSMNAYTYSSSLARQLQIYYATTDPYYLKLINKTENQFGTERFTPSNLGLIDKSITVNRDIEVDVRVVNALYGMFAEMKHDGVDEGLLVTSGYRSYKYQEELFKLYKNYEKTTISDDARAFFGMAYIEEHYTSKGLTALTDEDAESVANYYSAKAGTSEHQTGLCVDVILNGHSELTTDFEHTRSFAWLSQNAHRFGFILRYPSGKSDVTGFTYEPWHFRYVGRDAATAIYQSGLTLEEYVAANA